MAGVFRPGDLVIWHKATRDGLLPIVATVLRVRAKGVTIRADNPDPQGEGEVTRHVRPAKLDLMRKAPKPGDNPQAEAECLFAEGEKFADQELDEVALGRFRAA